MMEYNTLMGVCNKNKPPFISNDLIFISGIKAHTYRKNGNRTTSSKCVNDLLEWHLLASFSIDLTVICWVCECHCHKYAEKCFVSRRCGMFNSIKKVRAIYRTRCKKKNATLSVARCEGTRFIS